MVYLADHMTSHELRGRHIGGYLLGVDLTKLDPANFFPDEDAFYSEVMQRPCLGWVDYGFEDPNITVKDAYNSNKSILLLSALTRTMGNGPKLISWVRILNTLVCHWLRKGY